MTDDDYQRFLRALAAKHLRRSPDALFILHETAILRRNLEAVSASARLLKVVRDRPDDPDLERALRENLLKSSPIERTREALEETGILHAFEEAGPVLFAQLRREAIPQEDSLFLREAGYTEGEIEILFAIAIHDARTFSPLPKMSLASSLTLLKYLGMQ